MQLQSTAVAFWKTLCRTGSWARDTVPNCSYKWLRTVSLGDKAWARCKQNSSAPVLQGSGVKLPSPVPAPLAQPREPVGAPRGRRRTQQGANTTLGAVSLRVPARAPGAARTGAGQGAARSVAPARLCCTSGDTLGFHTKVGILEFGSTCAKSRKGRGSPNPAPKLLLVFSVCSCSPALPRPVQARCYLRLGRLPSAPLAAPSPCSLPPRGAQ